MKYLLLLIVIFILSACHSTLQQANERGLEQMKQNQYAEAITTFNTILKEKADWYPAYYNRAISHANLKQYNQALKDFNYFLANFPNHANSYLNRAILYENLGQYAQAIKDYSETIKLHPTSIVAYHYRGIARFHMNDFDGALQDYNQALLLGKDVKMDIVTAKEIGLNSSALYFNRGVVLQKKGNYKAAVQDYTQAIAIDPSNAKIYYNRAIAQMSLSQSEEAKKDLEIASHLGLEAASKTLTTYFPQ